MGTSIRLELECDGERGFLLEDDVVFAAVGFGAWFTCWCGEDCGGHAEEEPFEGDHVVVLLGKQSTSSKGRLCVCMYMIDLVSKRCTLSRAMRRRCSRNSSVQD